MAKTISKSTSSTVKKVEAGAGHPEPVEQGQQGGHSEPVAVKKLRMDALPEEVEVPRALTPEELLILGKDAPLTEMVYGGKQVFNPDSAPQLPEATGQTQGEMSPLQRFINLYQPGEIVMKNNFRKHLLTVLEDWKNG
jgi:hypothetical protein